MVEQKENKGRGAKIKKYHLLILILFLFLLAGIFLRFRSSSKSQLRLKIEEIHSKGYPVTLKELDQSYSIPDNVENAADFILDAVSYYNEPNDATILNIINDWAKLSPQREPLSDETIKQIVKYLRDNQKSLDLLHKAETLKYCRYPVNLSAGQTLQLINIDTMVKLLGFEAIVHAENGDSEASAKSLKCGLDIADSLSDVPSSICQIGRMVYLERNIETLEHIINSIDFTDEQLAQLSKAIADNQRISGISYGLTGELCSAISRFEVFKGFNFLTNANMSLSERLFYSVYRSVGLIESDGIIYLDITSKFIEAGKLPLEKRLEAVKQIQTEIANISEIHMVLKTTVPNYTEYLSRELSNISELRVAHAAIAVQRYRLKYGKLPDSLNNLIPEFIESVPSDPFDGKELRYKKLDSGFVVYSVDEDLIDDGGREEPKDKSQKIPHWDITFTIKK
jgi:hypothetical protein